MFMPDDADRIADIVAELRARFVVRAREQRRQLAALCADILGTKASQAAIMEIERLCHNLRGTAGTFGYGEIGTAAEVVELQCEGMGEADASSDDPAIVRLAAALDHLCALIDGLASLTEPASRFSEAGSRHLPPTLGSA